MKSIAVKFPAARHDLAARSRCLSAAARLRALRAPLHPLEGQQGGGPLPRRSPARHRGAALDFTGLEAARDLPTRTFPERERPSCAADWLRANHGAPAIPSATARRSGGARAQLIPEGVKAVATIGAHSSPGTSRVSSSGPRPDRCGQRRSRPRWAQFTIRRDSTTYSSPRPRRSRSSSARSVMHSPRDTTVPTIASEIFAARHPRARLA